MLLRRFYISENATGESRPTPQSLSRRTDSSSLSAPKPKKKSNRVLKTEIPDVPSSPSSSLSRSSTPVAPDSALTGAPSTNAPTSPLASLGGSALPPPVPTV